MKIDWWTLGIEAVNVAVLVWLLARFFWRPVAAMIAQRRTAAAQELADATAKRAEADKALEEIASTRAGLAKEREIMLAAAAGDADKERAARLGKTAKEIDAVRAAAEAAIAEEKEAATSAWRNHAGTLAVEIAARLLTRLDGGAVREAFLDSLMREVAALTEMQRNGLASAKLDLVSAAPLTADEQGRCQAWLATVLGAPPQLAFQTDARLIAGLALHGSNLVVSNNWRGDLDRILAELSHD
jgi:F-type H+-transporting ATPase subunit b